MRLTRRCMVISAVLILLVVVCSCAKKQDSLEELLSLGQKYLTEENYEEAVVAFEKAIAADEKSVEAYIGLADAYAGQGEMEKAAGVLDKGYEITHDQAILDKKEVYGNPESGENRDSGPVEPKDEEMAGSGDGENTDEENTSGYRTSQGTAVTKVDSTPALTTLASALESGGISVTEKGNTEFWNLMNSEELSGLMESVGGAILLPLSGDPLGGSGSGMGIYDIDGNGWLAAYFGGYSDGQRSGHGVWVTGMGGAFEGEWSGDAPNGKGTLTNAVSVMEGSLVDGKWDGEVTDTNKKNGIPVHLHFTDGIPTVIGTEDWGDGHVTPVLARFDDGTSEGNVYICEPGQEDVPWGIDGFCPGF